MHQISVIPIMFAVLLRHRRLLLVCLCVHACVWSFGKSAWMHGLNEVFGEFIEESTRSGCLCLQPRGYQWLSHEEEPIHISQIAHKQQQIRLMPCFVIKVVHQKAADRWANNRFNSFFNLYQSAYFDRNSIWVWKLLKQFYLNFKRAATTSILLYFLTLQEKVWLHFGNHVTQPDAWSIISLTFMVKLWQSGKGSFNISPDN